MKLRLAPVLRGIRAAAGVTREAIEITPLAWLIVAADHAGRGNAALGRDLGRVMVVMVRNMPVLLSRLRARDRKQRDACECRNYGSSSSWVHFFFSVAIGPASLLVRQAQA
jgi:hypothetical protein